MSIKLKTDRLTIRPVLASDASEFVDVCGEYDIVKMTATWPWPVTLEFAEERFRKAQKFDHNERVMFAILHQDDFIGSAGLGIKDETRVTQLGYMIGRPWWGKGVMTEAVRALCKYGFSALKANAIEADHYHDNPASGRVLEKVGFVKTGPADHTYSAARGENVPGWAYRLTPESLKR